MEAGSPLSPSQAWAAALGELQLQMPRSTFDTWLKPTYVLGHEDGTYVIATNNPYARDWLENRLMGMIQSTLTKVTGRTVELRFVVRQQTPSGPDLPVLGQPQAEPRERQDAQKPEAVHRLLPSNLNPRYTFETFVVGKGNELAHAAALAVAEHPAERYNPLFLYGDVGLGKTHLLHAIGHGPVRRNLHVLYISAEEFTNEIVTAIQRQRTDEFRAKYRAVDVLLIDDIQFIAGKERTQEEFFHTFNALHSANRQIVITSDRPPKAFTTLEERLCSRFQWGLIVDIQPPDLETRIAILRDKAERQRVQVPTDVLEYIATEIHSNIRALEGALTQVLAYAELMGNPLTVETAQRALHSFMMERPRPSGEQILHVVAEYFRVDVTELTGQRRNRQVVWPRQVAMYLMRNDAGLSLPQIGQLLGGRDHSTVLHGCEKIADALEKNEQLRRDLMALRERLQHVATH